MNNQVIIKTKISSRDIFIFQFSYLIRQWYSWIILYFSLISIVNIITRLVASRLSEVPPMSWFFSFMILIFFLSIFIGSKRSAKNKFILEEKTYTISEEYLFLESESTTQKILWKDFSKYVLTKRFVYLFVANNSAHFIPISELSNEEKQFIIQNVKSKVKKHKNGCLFAILIFLIIFVVTVGIIQFLLASK